MDSIFGFLSATIEGQPAGFWLGFVALILTLLVLDLFVFNRRDHVAGVTESVRQATGYFAVACIFGLWVWNTMGSSQGIDFFTAYLVEQSLSLDNIFVMSLIFAYFKVPRIYQHRVLFWGIVGVIVFRAVMIYFGAALIHSFEWVLLIFAGFLIVTGIKLLSSKDSHPAVEENRIISFLKKKMPVTQTMNGHSFFVREPHIQHGRIVLHATPLFLALISIECADIIFAFDSVPAVFAITTDTFIVYTSNIFAIIGLRAMYFVLTAIIHRFSYMNYALSLILIMIGAKVFYAFFTGDKVAPWISLGLTLGILVGGFLFSYLKTRGDAAHKPAQGN